MFNYILYRVGEFLTLYLPFKLDYCLARIISTFQYLLSSADRTSVRNNLRAIFPDIDNRILERYTRGVFINFGRYLTVFFKSRKLTPGFFKKNVVVEGRENIDKALSLGRGAIILSAHIGNWELGGMAMGLLGYPMNAVTLTHKHKKAEDFFNRNRESRNMKVIPLGVAVKKCLEAFSRNEIVCILGDRDFTQGGIVVDFFGRPSLIPKGPAVFYLRNKTPIVTGFTVREPSGRIRLSFGPPLEFEPSGDYEKDIRAVTGIYLRQIEDCVRKYPEQWYMFRKFWLD